MIQQQRLGEAGFRGERVIGHPSKLKGRNELILSGTATEASGRVLSGQTVGAFWASVRPGRPLAVGRNCAMGAALMRPYLADLARLLSNFARDGLVNRVGGCCGTTPEHITAVAAAIRPFPPHSLTPTGATHV